MNWPILQNIHKNKKPEVIPALFFLLTPSDCLVGINKSVPEPSYILDVEEIELPYPIFVYQKGDTVKELDTIYIPLPHNAL